MQHNKHLMALLFCSFVLHQQATAGGPGGPGVFDAPWLGFDLGDYDDARFAYAGATGDFDGDGDVDVATASWSNFPRMVVLLNNGDGTYGAPASHTLAKASRDIVASDFDGDSDVDLVASNAGINGEGNTISLFRNTGNGTFQAHQQFSVGTGSAGPEGLASADFDLDGD